MENQVKQSENLIAAVKYWLEKTVIGYNFCPFARKEFINNTLHYEVVDESDTQEQLMALSHELTRLDENTSIATTLILYPKGLESFFDYLDFLELANGLLYESGYEGTYQIASFHPDYCFADSRQDDPANYTNRSPTPLIHLLREQQLEKVLAQYPNPEAIPETNIKLAQALGQQPFELILREAARHLE